MKWTFALILGAFVVVSIDNVLLRAHDTTGKQVYAGELPIQWEYDGVRQHKAKIAAQEAYAKEFHKTNTNPALWPTVEWDNIYWNPQKGQKELGYRSDGVVVWRELPEGK